VSIESPESVAVLCGGFGAARFLTGFRGTEGLGCIVNTADDVEHAGLHVSPDVDSVVYALAGRFDEERGWGLEHDSFACTEALGRFGLDWFRIGDMDLATCLWRTRLLQDGVPLSEVCRRQAAAFGLTGAVLPMSDEPVCTVFDTDRGELAFQEFVVRDRGEPQITGVRVTGLEAARPAAGVLELLEDAGTILIAPSNPITSIGPILAVAGIRELLTRRRQRVVAVSPIVVGREPITQPEVSRARLRKAVLAAHGLAHTPVSAAQLWRDVAGGFVLDRHDEAFEPEIRALGLRTLIADTLAAAPEDRARLADAVLAFARASDLPSVALNGAGDLL
jgi:LPPG:FO 2-phospho-L-lactate transferase